MTDPADIDLSAQERERSPVTRTVVDGVLVLTVHEATFAGSTANALFHAVSAWGHGLPDGERLAAVVDVSKTAFDPSGQQLRVGASRVRGLRLRGRVALRVSGDFQYGLGRMLGILCEGSGIEVRPYQLDADALAWVREPDEEESG